MEIKTFTIKCLAPLLVSAMLISACKKDTASNVVNLPVVEAYLMAGKQLQVKLYGQKALTDTAKYGSPLKGLQLSVSDGSKTVQLTESPAGTYIYTDTTFLTAGKTYILQFNYLNTAVSATTVMPGKPINFATQHSGITIPTSTTNSTIDTLDVLSWQNPDSLNHVLVFNNLDGTSFGINGFGFNRSASFELNTNRASKYFVTRQPFSYYGHYQVVLLRVNQEYINLLTSNSSNSTSQTLKSQPTNVTNGLGIFTAMQADTVNLLVQ